VATLVFPGGPGLALLGGGLAMSVAVSESACPATLVGVGVQVSPTALASGAQIIPSALANGAQVIPSVEACTSSVFAPVLGIALLLIVLIAPVVVAIVLLGRARSRVALDVHEPAAREHLTHHGRQALPRR
jgi:hypothetical protein